MHFIRIIQNFCSQKVSFLSFLIVLLNYLLNVYAHALALL